jgi:hypothetical protein
VFCVALLAHGHVTVDQVLALVSRMPLDEASCGRLSASIRRWAKAARPAI